MLCKKFFMQLTPMKELFMTDLKGKNHQQLLPRLVEISATKYHLPKHIIGREKYADQNHCLH